jgi:hypothetical protein
VRPHRAPATCGPSRPACPCTPHTSLYGIRCLAHETWVKMLGAALTIPSVSTSGNQRSTDLSVRRGLAGLSASALQGVPCACPALSRTIAEWQSTATHRRARASTHVFSACGTSVCLQALSVNTRHGGREPAMRPQESRCLACPSAPNAWSRSGDMGAAKPRRLAPQHMMQWG